MDQQNARAYALLSPALISLALFLVAPIIFVIIYSFWLRTAEGLDVPAFQFGNWIAVLTDYYYWLGLYSTFKTALITTCPSVPLDNSTKPSPPRPRRRSHKACARASR